MTIDRIILSSSKRARWRAIVHRAPLTLAQRIAHVAFWAKFSSERAGTVTK